MGTLKQASKILSIFDDTSTEQVQAILASGFLADLRDGNIAGVNRDEFRRLLSLKSICPPLLDSAGAITIAATASVFIAREKFVIDTNRKAKTKIAWLSDNFKNWFLGKTEVSASETTLQYARLTRSALDGEIRKEIGAESEETTLAQIFALMEWQKSGESGALLTDGCANIFYVRDANSVLRAVRVIWNAIDGGWDVSAFSVSNPYGWVDGCQVFSRSS